jgi:hypothetical protein
MCGPYVKQTNEFAHIHRAADSTVAFDNLRLCKLAAGDVFGHSSHVLLNFFNQNTSTLLSSDHAKVLTHCRLSDTKPDRYFHLAKFVPLD